MRRAISLALKGAGLTSPNPMVGAIVVKKGRIVGQGYHRRAGTPHAEIHALRRAGQRAGGADLYVTLEPCVHEGRTPPCVPAIVGAGIVRTFIGTCDPNPVINGRGIRALKKSGVVVIRGVLTRDCIRINETYNKFIVSGIPFVTAKVALSLDGKIATLGGESQWITNEACRRYVHKLRARVDAVIVGGGTVRRDDPRLDVRIKEWHGLGPKAVVIDEALNLPRSSRIFRRAAGSTVILTTSRAPRYRRRWIEKMGHTVIACRATSDGMVFLTHALAKLGGLGITSALVEGGGQLFADFFQRGLVDRVVACIAPKLIGGIGMDFLPGLQIRHLAGAISLREVHARILGDNVVIEGILK